MSFPVSTSTMCLQASSTSSIFGHYQVLSADASSDVTPTEHSETRLTPDNLDNDSFATDLVEQLYGMQVSIKEQRGNLIAKVQGLVTTQETLKLQLLSSQTQAEHNLAQREARIAELERKNKQLQEQRAKLSAQQIEKNENWQKQLEDAKKARTHSLEFNKEIWDFHTNSYNSQIQSLQQQVNSLQPIYNAAVKEKTRLNQDKDRLNRQLDGLTSRSESLQNTARDEWMRQDAAVKTKVDECRQHILNILDQNIGTYRVQGNIMRKHAAGRIDEANMGLWSAHPSTGPDGKQYNPISAEWATVKAREMVTDCIK